jgi:sugar phosphate permease
MTVGDAHSSRSTETREFEAATMRKVSRRLIPFLFVLFVVAYLDRVNIGFAQLQMKGALGFSDTVYGLGTGIFFIGYFLFEVPSNLILTRTGARVWFARIMITWGLISSAMVIVRTPQGFYTLRFLLVVADSVLERNRCSGRDRAHQLNRKSRRIRRAISDWVRPRRDRRLQG